MFCFLCPPCVSLPRLRIQPPTDLDERAAEDEVGGGDGDGEDGDKEGRDEEGAAEDDETVRGGAGTCVGKDVEEASAFECRSLHHPRTLPVLPKPPTPVLAHDR
jgi:hypothetical protein